MPDDSFEIRKGRHDDKNYLNTKFYMIDAILQSSDITHLGFYETFRRFINRKDSSKENQITYRQKNIRNSMNISDRKYYECIKFFFNVDLLDIEKSVTVSFFLNLNNGTSNELFNEKIVFFSTHENIDLPLKDNILNLLPLKYPKEFVKIIKAETSTSYIIHDYPPEDKFDINKPKLTMNRNWDIHMDRFRRGSNKNSEIDNSMQQGVGEIENNPSFQYEKTPSLHIEKDPSLHSEKSLNNITNSIANITNLLNNRIKIPGNIISQSVSLFSSNRQTDKFRELLVNLIKELENDTELKEIAHIARYTIADMYYFDDFSIKINKSVPEIRMVLQKINLEMVLKAVKIYWNSEQKSTIEYPYYYFRGCLWNVLNPSERRKEREDIQPLDIDPDKESNNSEEMEELNYIKSLCEFHLWDNQQDIDNLESAIEKMFFSEYINVDNSRIPKEIVRARMHKLNGSILISAYSSVQDNKNNGTEWIKKFNNYLIAAIYNEITEYYLGAYQSTQLG